jgi:hypothetical protein
VRQISAARGKPVPDVAWDDAVTKYEKHEVAGEMVAMRAAQRADAGGRNVSAEVQWT